MAGWDQAVGPALLRDDADDLTPLTNEAVDQFLTSDTDGAGFGVAGLAKIAVAAAFSQDSIWSASAIEIEPGAGGWEQDATWSATALNAPPVSGDATFDQAAASWLAESSESIPATAAFSQTEIWDAEAGESIPSSATWSQDASWGAEGQSAEDVTADATFDQTASWLGSSSELSIGSASWEQVATWDAVGSSVEADNDVSGEAAFGQSAIWAALVQTSSVVVSEPPVVRFRRGQILRPKRIHGRASFGQEPAEWHATVSTTDDVEALLLALT